jgi:hypothetical protein
MEDIVGCGKVCFWTHKAVIWPLTFTLMLVCTNAAIRWEIMNKLKELICSYFVHNFSPL